MRPKLLSCGIPGKHKMFSPILKDGSSNSLLRKGPTTENRLKVIAKRFSCQDPAIKRYRINVMRTKRQRILSSSFPGQFTAKHYPCIFLDQRLRSRFNEHTIYRAK